jgi:hypothetical protein
VIHIPLDGQDESVRKFILSLPIDPHGSLLELNGRAIARVLPATTVDRGPIDETWTEEKNNRRCALIDREIEGTLDTAEAIELQLLQAEMLRYRRKMAPLPLEDARALHQELIARAARSAAP